MGQKDIAQAEIRWIFFSKKATVYFAEDSARSQCP